MSYHLIGIGGIGMSGLARLLAELKLPVSGSDVSEGEMVEDLRSLGIPVFINHDPKNVPEQAQVVYSSGISAHNPELLHAQAFQLPLLHRADLLQRLMQDSKSLLVAGSHGKTTTTSLLTSVLLYSGLSPSYAIGGVLNETNTNAGKGSGHYFVAEADESDGSFLKYRPFGAIITNIGNDHIDYYRSEDNLTASFKQFGEGVASKKHLFFCYENEQVRSCNFQGVSYGFCPEAELRGSRFRQQGWKLFFDAEFENRHYASIEIPLIGYHNALNALAVFGMALKVEIPEQTIREAFKNFKGVKRRCEKKGEIHKIEVRDDYGHHPNEIHTTLKAIKNASLRRLIVLFQPHRYSRTKQCLEQFRTCFEEADEVLVTDIYPAGEKQEGSIHASHIVEGLKNGTYVPKETLVEEALKRAQPFDLFLTLGAGDIWKQGVQLLEKLREAKKIKIGLISGGQSSEHEISLRSVKNIEQGLSEELFTIDSFFISKEGKWGGSEAIITPEILASLLQCDVVFPVLHGPYGEDGTIQGFFEMLNIPYVGCNHQSSAVCMDKAVTKKLAEAAGLRVAPYIDFNCHQWRDEQESLLKEIQRNLLFPLFVKPVHLGSTIGVRKVETKGELIAAIDAVFACDYHVLIEKQIKGRELEFAVWGDREIHVFPPGEILNFGAVYDYAAKYGAHGCDTIAKAHLDEGLIEDGMAFAKKAYLSAGCDGYARVDCFLDEENFFYLNEINPIPGFTENSLYPKMCERNGLPLHDLLGELICLSLARHRLRKKCTH